MYIPSTSDSGRATIVHEDVRPYHPADAAPERGRRARRVCRRVLYVDRCYLLHENDRPAPSSDGYCFECGERPPKRTRLSEL